MRKIVFLVVALTALVSTSANAQGWYGRPYYHHDNSGVAFVTGALIGAALMHRNQSTVVEEVPVAQQPVSYSLNCHEAWNGYGWVTRCYRIYHPVFSPAPSQSVVTQTTSQVATVSATCQAAMNSTVNHDQNVTQYCK